VRAGRRLAAARTVDGCDRLAALAAAATADRARLVADADRVRTESRWVLDEATRFSALHADAVARRDAARDLACALEEQVAVLREACAEARRALAPAPDRWAATPDLLLAVALADTGLPLPGPGEER